MVIFLKRIKLTVKINFYEAPQKKRINQSGISCSCLHSFTPPPLSFINYFPKWIIQNPFSMAITTAEFSYVPLSVEVREHALTVGMEIIGVAHIDVSIGLGDLGPADQSSLHPLALELFAIGEHQKSTAAIVSDAHMKHLLDHCHSSALSFREQLKHAPIFQFISFFFGRDGVVGLSFGAALLHQGLSLGEGEREAGSGGLRHHGRVCFRFAGCFIFHFLQISHAFGSDSHKIQFLHPETKRLLVLLGELTLLSVTIFLYHLSNNKQKTLPIRYLQKFVLKQNSFRRLP